MSKRLIIAGVVIGLMALAVPTYAAVQNVKVSGDLTVMGVGRNSFQLDDVGDSQSALLSIARLRADFDLTDKVSAVIRLINERPWGEEYDYSDYNPGATSQTTRSDTTAIDLDLAYVVLKEFLYSPLTLTIGRQELRFGNALIVGDPDTNGAASNSSALNNPNLANGFRDLSARKAFDALRITLNYDPLTIDGIWSKIDEGSSISNDDTDLYGFNANYVVNNDLDVEGYYFNRVRQGPGLVGTNRTVGQSDTAHTVGARGLFTGIKNLTLGLEAAYQFGNRITTGAAPNAGTYPDDNAAGRGTATDQVLHRRAWALQAISSYLLSDNQYKPTVKASFTHLSGAKDGTATNDDYEGWDPLFEDQAGGTIFNRILGYSNCNLYNVGASIKPWEDITVAFEYYHIRLDQPYSKTRLAARNISGVTGDTTYTMTENREIGNEADINLTYDYTEDVQFGMTMGWFRPGKAFGKTNNKVASQVIGKMKVTF